MSLLLRNPTTLSSLFDLQNCPRIGDILEFVSFDFKGSMNKHARTVFKLEKCTVSGECGHGVQGALPLL